LFQNIFVSHVTMV